jgi:isochorismate hydrolase
MKLILEFDYKDNEFENNAAKRAMNATEAYLVIYKMREYFIKKVKDDCSSDIQFALNELNAIMDDFGVDLDDLE